MSTLRTCGNCIRRQPPLHTLPRNTRLLTTRPNPRHSTNNTNAAVNPLRTGTTRRARAQEIASSRHKMNICAAGIAACAVAMYGVIALDLFGLKEAEERRQKFGNTVPVPAAENITGSNGAMRMDGPAGFPGTTSNESGGGGHGLIRVKGQDGVDHVETGTSTIPYFPSTIHLPKSSAMDPTTLKPSDEVSPETTEHEEYQLLGLGIRTVSFLRIQVYVVGLYVATNDISELQQRLVRTAVSPPPLPHEINDNANHGVIANGSGATFATSLVPGERAQLKDMLLGADRSEAVWNAILKKDGLRTAFRIVPTRNTDFLHLRDGWVRGITGRAQAANARAASIASSSSSSSAGGPGGASEFQDDSFGDAMNTFKALFGGGQRKSVPKGQTLLLLRSRSGELDALLQTENEADPAAAQNKEGERVSRWLGRVGDERISRLVWLNYLAGKNVSSEGARQSVVDGVMGIVERPVGTVVQKIV